MKCILARMMGGKYPKVNSSVYADGIATKVVATVTFDPDHVDFDSPNYIESKWRKKIPALESIGTSHNEETGEQSIIVSMDINGNHNKVSDIKSLEKMAVSIASIAEDRLSEPEVIKNIGEDCKPWFDEEAQYTDA